jgi:hypothetical protein
MRAGLRHGHSDGWIASILPAPPFLTVLIIMMLACYRLRARRHAPGLTPTVCLKTRVR